MSFNLLFALKKSIWKGFLPIVYPLYRILKKLMKSESKFLKEMPFQLTDIEIDFHLNMASLFPEKFARKVGKLLAKTENTFIKNQLNRKIKILSMIGESFIYSFM
jgi:hypothetical protein